MFTGLITDVGTLQAIDGDRMTIACHYAAADIAIGSSIACDGCCLTAVIVAEDKSTNGSIFSVDVSNETRQCTSLKSWIPGQRINLEKSLRLGDEMGGHLVTGHVDGVAELIGLEPDGASVRYSFRSPVDLSKFIAPKGSIALNGTSLTVNTVEKNEFEVNLIPHTLEVTTWSECKLGDLINLEVDLLARYVARLNDTT